MVNLNSTANSVPQHSSPIFHHIIHYHPSVPFQYAGPTGWNISHAGHMWDVLLLLESYPETYPVAPVDKQHTELLRRFWVDELATKLTLTEAGVWPLYNKAELGGKGGPTYTLELLENDEKTSSPEYVVTENYHSDKCAFLREYGFAESGWAN
jgi:hypothetical protein